MRRKISFFFFLLLLPITQALTAGDIEPGADALVGTWISQARDSRTEIRKAGATYCGTLLAGWGNKLYEADGRTLRRDVRNPDARLRDRPLLDMVILSNLRYENGTYTGGKLYDARTGKPFSCRMKLRDGKLAMRLYWGLPLLGTTKRWTRTEQ